MNKPLSVLLLSLVLVGCTNKVEEGNASQEELVEIMVNPAIDLFGIISRLAGINQYTEVLLPTYMNQLENSFEPFRDHPCIEFARECNIRHQINGDAPMALAVYVGPPPELDLRMDLSKIPESFDPRWDSTLISDYLEHARRFAVESNYMDFHKRQKDFHLAAMYNLKEMLSREQIFAWYAEFFGYDPENFLMYLALHNGSCNYGYPVFYSDGETEFVSLIGGRFPDKEGLPTYPGDWFLPLIIHEYAHSYINPLIKSHAKEFRELGEALLLTQRAKMVEYGYNVWNVILQEYLVRAFTIRYMEEMKGKNAARKLISRDINNGFTEIEGLVELLDEYAFHRNNYPDMESFLPEIKKYFESSEN